MGPIYLDPRLAKGAYRSLTRAEMERLRPYFTVHQKERTQGINSVIEK